MRHKNRARDRANEKRRGEAAEKQIPLPIEEQQKRAKKREDYHKAMYPYPPNYDLPMGEKGKI